MKQIYILILTRYFASDQSHCIKALIEDEFPSINHQYDIWHLSKVIMWVMNGTSNKNKRKDQEMP